MTTDKKNQVSLRKLSSMCIGVCLSVLPMVTMAELNQLDDEALANTQAQAGVNIGLDMVINKVNNENANDKACAQNSGNCQFGMRFDNQNNPELWLTFTGVSGGVKIPKLNVQGVDLTNQAGDTKQGIKFTLNNQGDNKVVFKDFGFDSLRLSGDKIVDGKVSGGYRNAVPFATGAGTELDAGRQPGFLGMRINGATTMTGSITMFDCGTC